MGCTIFFNYLIYHSTDYDKQELAAYNSFEDYRLLDDGYVESLLTAQLNQEGVHVYVAKVRPVMKIKMNEGREHYNLWFILEGRVQAAEAFFRHNVSVTCYENKK